MNRVLPATILIFMIALAIPVMADKAASDKSIWSKLFGSQKTDFASQLEAEVGAEDGGCSCEANREAIENMRFAICKTFINAGITPDPALHCDYEERGACCHPKISYVNESGVYPVKCLNAQTEYKCGLLQGAWTAGKSCGELDSVDCPSLGACCYQKEGSTKCQNGKTPAECAGLGGLFSDGQQCSSLTTAQCSGNLEPASAATGSCCHPKISYVNESGVFPVNCLDTLTEYKCGLLQGTWSGTETCSSLGSEGCPPSGACCHGTPGAETCTNMMSSAECTLLSGSFYSGQVCSALPSGTCPAIVQAADAPTGSCCNPKISYVNESGVFPVKCLDSLTEYKCKLLQGTWRESTSCGSLTPDECTGKGGCCYTGEGSAKCANWLAEDDCAKLSGSFFEGAQCSSLIGSQCGAGDTESAGTDFEETGNQPQTVEKTGACCLPEVSEDRCMDGMTGAECTRQKGKFSQGKKCSGLSEQECTQGKTESQALPLAVSTATLKTGPIATATLKTNIRLTK
jgi:hypothetical protein